MPNNGMPSAKPMLGATCTHEIVARSVCMSRRIFSIDATNTVVGNEVAATPTIKVATVSVSRRPSTVPPEVTDVLSNSERSLRTCQATFAV